MQPWWQAIVDEFSDLPNIADATRVGLRLAIAALLSGTLGFERERKHKSAGLRTHMLVGIGAAIFVLIPQRAGVADDAIMRVVQGVVAGIGFLGAGSIIKGDGENTIHGLTTAASIWLTAAIGISAGMGREATAVLCTLLALAVLALLPRVETWIAPSNREPHDNPRI